MQENIEKQVQKQYDWLKQYQWQKGQSGNPKGKTPGKSLKTFVKELFESMSDEDKSKFLKVLNPELIWRMGEGNPTNDDSLKISGSIDLEQIINKANEPNPVNATMDPKSD